MDPSTAVSFFALLASLFALGWQLLRARWERPVVVVNGTISSRQTLGQTPKMDFRIDVFNVGERPVSVVGVGWITKRQPNGFDSINVNSDELSELPIRLEAHDSKSWVITRPEGETHAVDEPYVQVVQRPTWRESRAGVAPKRTVFGKIGGSAFDV